MIWTWNLGANFTEKPWLTQVNGDKYTQANVFFSSLCVSKF